jgi:hypothetical protein
LGAKASPVHDTHTPTGEGAGADTGQPDVLDITTAECQKCTQMLPPTGKAWQSALDAIGNQ